MSVLRHEPRNSRIINAVSAAAMTPSRKTPLMAARTNSDWSANSLTCRSGVTVAMTVRQRGFDASDDVQRGGVAGFHDGQQRAAHAVLAHGILLRRVAVVDLRHVAHVNGGAVDDS